MIPFMSLSSQYESIEKEMRVAVDRVLASGWYVLGKECEAFEAEFAAYTGAAHCVGVGSGTDALTMALRSAGVEQGDRVATIANSCPPTATAIANVGAQLAFVDCAAGDVHMAHADTNARANVPVHLYGHPSPVDTSGGGIVVEDCAQAHGALMDGQACGTFGHAGAYSFYPTKTLGAYGDAGAIITNDEGIADEARAFRNYGQEQRYEALGPGMNSRLDEIQAAILRVKLKHLPEWITARQERAGRYDERLRGVVDRPAVAENATHAYHLYVIRSPRRDALRAHLDAQGIQTQIHYPIPLHKQPAFAQGDLPAEGLPHAERACAEVLSLPLYPELVMGDVDAVADAIEAFFT